jgi:hypothetical protein
VRAGAGVSLMDAQTDDLFDSGAQSIYYVQDANRRNLHT